MRLPTSPGVMRRRPRHIRRLVCLAALALLLLLAVPCPCRGQGCPEFSERSGLAPGCGCVRAVLDANRTVFRQGFFSLARPSKAKGGCHPCPYGGECLGAAHTPKPQAGFWTNEGCPVAFAACEENLELGRTMVCLPPDQAHAYGRCREGHEGVLCHRCSDGFGRQEPTTPFCQRCRGRGPAESDFLGRVIWREDLRVKAWHFLALAFEVAVSTGSCLSLIFTGLEADKRDNPEMSQILKVLFSYTTITKLLLSGNTRGWPESLQLFITTHKPPSPDSATSSFDCWLANENPNKAMFTYVLQLLPTLASVCLCTVFLYLYAYRLTTKYLKARGARRVGAALGWKRDESRVKYPELMLLIGNEDLHASLLQGGEIRAEDGHGSGDCEQEDALSSLAANVTAATRIRLPIYSSVVYFVRKLWPRVAIVCATTMWPQLLRFVLGFFACGTYPKSFLTDCGASDYMTVMGEKVFLWEFDKETQCFTGAHSKMLQWVTLPTLFVIGFPFFTFLLLRRNHRKMYVNDHFDYTYGFLYRDYEPHMYFWESVIQVRNFALTALIVFYGTTIKSQDLQALLLLVVIFISVLLHTMYLPYVLDSVDLAHQIVLVDVAVIVMSSMFFKLDASDDVPYWHQLRELLGLLVALLHVGTILVMGLFTAKAALRTYALKADADGDNKVSLQEAELYFGTSAPARILIRLMTAVRLVEKPAPPVAPPTPSTPPTHQPSQAASPAQEAKKDR